MSWSQLLSSLRVFNHSITTTEKTRMACENIIIAMLGVSVSIYVRRQMSYLSRACKLCVQPTIASKLQIHKRPDIVSYFVFVCVCT